jgi:hypothetical protein
MVTIQNGTPSGMPFLRFPFLAESDCLNKQDKAKYTSLIELSPDVLGLPGRAFLQD